MHTNGPLPRKARRSPGICIEAPFHVTLLTDGRLSCLKFPAKSSLQSVAAIIGSDHGFQVSSDIRIKVEVVSHTEARGNVRIVNRGFAKKLLHLLGPYRQQSAPKKHTPNSLEPTASSNYCIPLKASTMHRIPENHIGLVSHDEIFTAHAADRDVTSRSLQFGCRGVQQFVGSSFESAQKGRSKACASVMKQSKSSPVALDLALQRSTGNDGRGQAMSYQSAQLQCVGVKQCKPTGALGAQSDDLTCTVVSCGSEINVSKPVSEISMASGFKLDAAARTGIDDSPQSPFEKIIFP